MWYDCLRLETIWELWASRSTDNDKQNDVYHTDRQNRAHMLVSYNSICFDSKNNSQQLTSETPLIISQCYARARITVKWKETIGFISNRFEAVYIDVCIWMIGLCSGEMVMVVSWSCKWELRVYLQRFRIFFLLNNLFLMNRINFDQNNIVFVIQNYSVLNYTAL